MEYDFSGWATKNDLLCSDGRVIRKDAFKHNDGETVPLVWNHCHNDPYNVLGHAQLKNRNDGVYAYCKFNESESGKNAKLLVQHGDVVALSIYANQLKQQGNNVLHGDIKEVSLVLAGANPGAFIDQSSIAHSADNKDENDGVIYTGEEISLYHADTSDNNNEEENKVAENTKSKKTSEEDEDEETIGDVFDTLTDKQKNVVYALIGQALQENGAKSGKGSSSDEEDEEVKHNVFDNDERDTSNVISHSEMTAIISDGKRYGSLKDSVLAHGIDDIDYLFPDAQNVTKTPQFIQREMGWVQKVMGAVHHTPFSRIKSILADITEDDARAKGYIKGNLKKEEVFSLLKRTTTPTTIYKKQKLDRDDIVDITDFDVVAWIKSEMRLMLDEEIARAVLIGDGRLASSDDKINESNIRPIALDEDLYTIKSSLDTYDAKDFIVAAIKARKDYKGSGEPTLYTTEDVLTDCLLIEDSLGRAIYEDVNKLAQKLRVKEIVTVPVMENATGANDGSLIGVIVNLADYTIGADKGGAVSMFDDFDIDYNAQKYLIETRCSGALIKPYSAIAIEVAASDSEEDAS